MIDICHVKDVLLMPLWQTPNNAIVQRYDLLTLVKPNFIIALPLPPYLSKNFSYYNDAVTTLGWKLWAAPQLIIKNGR